MGAIQAVLGAEQDEAKKAAVASAMEAGRAYVESQEYGRETTPELQAAFERADAAVLSPMRALSGWTGSGRPSAPRRRCPSRSRVSSPGWACASSTCTA